ncbi:hypothetical protein I6B53_03200 [Schaalia sp. 19OD2882]|uniref:hypothetical protein n=1 Tax=Schaalia sp. 19OD2882 TaxID=2794089 RepID=UPI001C1EBCAD|nr:hypothetical protein [Schaalia sp. 19OD2882]QWW20117.1 hypothetical protein I6B53_03200 [Schaalia sp. 19OD2882]
MRDRYQWTDQVSGCSDTCRLQAWADDHTRIEFHIADVDGYIESSFVVFPTRGPAASSDDTAEWPTVEAYVPRTDWPAEMPTGKGGPAADQRHPDQAVLDALEDYRCMLADDDEGDGDDTWVDAYLGDSADETSGEQKELIVRAAARLDALMPGQDMRGERETALGGAVKIILGDETVQDVGRAERRAVHALEQAKLATTGAMVAAELTGRTITGIADMTGLTRRTVYKRLARRG